MSTPSHSCPEVSGAKAKYHLTNWPEYDRALVKRGSLTVWFNRDFVDANWRPTPNGKRGAPFKYSDAAIQTLLMMKMVFGLTYRSLEGFARSLVVLMGLGIDIPDHSHMARRAKTLQVRIPRKARKEPMHVVVDSTGLKISPLKVSWRCHEAHGTWIHAVWKGRRRAGYEAFWGFEVYFSLISAIEYGLQPGVASGQIRGSRVPV